MPEALPRSENKVEFKIMKITTNLSKITKAKKARPKSKILKLKLIAETELRKYLRLNLRKMKYDRVRPNKLKLFSTLP